MPTLTGIGVPAPGGGVGIRIDNGPPGGSGILFLGTAPASLPTNGCTFLVGGTVVSTALPLDASGSFEVTTVLPEAVPPAAQIHLQFLAGDTAAANGVFSATAGLTMLIQ